MSYSQAIINKADSAITTGSFNNGGLLAPEQARKFIQQSFESNELGKAVRHVMRTSRSGEIDKIGVGSRLLRKKVESTDDGYRATPNTSKIEYSTVAVRLPWEITEETLRENIEGENLDKIITDLMTAQVGLDHMDLCMNGDKDIPAQYNAGTTQSPDMKNTPDYNFLSINNGWAKKIKNGGHVVDMSTSSTLKIDMFYDAIKAIPNKYNNGKLRWLMSPHMAQEWEMYLLNKCLENGSTAPDSLYKAPGGIPHIQCSCLSDNQIILTDPKNLIVTNTYTMKIRKTTEGEKAIMEDKRFYVIHFDSDSIIEELDATAIITGIPSF